MQVSGHREWTWISQCKRPVSPFPSVQGLEKLCSALHGPCSWDLELNAISVIIKPCHMWNGFSVGSDGKKESSCNAGDPGFNPWVGKIPWKRESLSTPVFLPGESHGQRSLAGYSPSGQTVRHDWATNTSLQATEREAIKRRAYIYWKPSGLLSSSPRSFTRSNRRSPECPGPKPTVFYLHQVFIWCW